MSIECARLGGINLAQGVCDTEVPEVVRRAVTEAVEGGINSYTRHDGLPQLREAIARKASWFNGLTVDPETEVVVSAGSTGAFYCALLALVDPGDEVILFEPYYGYHVSTLLAVEAVPRVVALEPPDWTFDAENLRQAISPKTRAIVINTPANPTGKIFTREELTLIAQVAEQHDLIVITDEIYEHFVYDDRQHISPASIPGLADRTITISGVSKTLSVTGWRVGYSISNAEYAEVIGFMNDLVYVCAPAPLQHATAVGLDVLDKSFYEGLATEYHRKRDVICDALSDAGLTPYIPEGAYYVLADSTALPGKTGKERAMWLLENAKVAGVPGEAFYLDGGGANLIRFCYAKRDEELAEAAQRLRGLRGSL